VHASAASAGRQRLDISLAATLSHKAKIEIRGIAALYLSLQKRQRMLLGVLLLIVLGAYANSFQNGFHFDDFHTVTDNPAIRTLRNLPRFFTDATTFSVLPSNRTYRPMVSSSLAMDYALGGGYAPFWFHLGTFLLFLLQVSVLYGFYNLVFEAVKPSSANGWLALCAAAWFGLHPVMAETVNYIVQRGDIYCTLGCVAALYLFARYPQKRRTGLYLLPLAFALLSKPPAVVFPVLLFFYIFFFEATGRRVRTSIVATLPSFALTAAAMALQAAMTPRTFLPSIISPWNYRLTQPYVWLRYFCALILPMHLNVDTDLCPFSAMNPEALSGLLFVTLIGILIWSTARRQALYPIAYGLIWFVVTQLPTSLYPLSEVENDHRMYLSFVGLMLTVVWAAWVGLEKLRFRWCRPIAAVIAVLLLCGYAYGVHARNQTWHDEESLWLDDVVKSPRNGRGLMIYGLTQMNKGNYSVALDYFQRAQLYTPNYPTLEVNLGVVHGAMADQGDVTRALDAERHFLRALSLAPDDDMSHALYGRWLSEQGRFDEAIAQLLTAISLNPVRPLPRELLMTAYSQSGDKPKARQAALDTLAVVPDDAAATEELVHPSSRASAFWLSLSLKQYRHNEFQKSIDSARRALQIDPNFAEAFNNIGAGYAGLHQWDEAVRNEREALRIKPDLQIAQNNLTAYLQRRDETTSAPEAGGAAAYFLNESLALNRAGKYRESIDAARRALRINPNMAEAWNNIAAGYEGLYQWTEAIDAAQKAIALKPDFQLARNNLAWSLSQKKLGVH
jgi:protein O-mannosyl-transferase